MSFKDSTGSYSLMSGVVPNSRLKIFWPPYTGTSFGPSEIRRPVLQPRLAFITFSRSWVQCHAQEVAVTFSSYKADLHLWPVNSGFVCVHVVTSVHLSLPSLTGVGPVPRVEQI